MIFLSVLTSYLYVFLMRGMKCLIVEKVNKTKYLRLGNAEAFENENIFFFFSLKINYCLNKTANRNLRSVRFTYASLIVLVCLKPVMSRRHKNM